jgi:methyl-accepting chemotaxis protein
VGWVHDMTDKSMNEWAESPNSAELGEPEQIPEGEHGVHHPVQRQSFSERFERLVTRNGTRYVSIRLKVGGAFAATLAVLVILSVVNIIRLTSLESEANRLAKHDMLVVQTAHQLYEDMLNMENGLRGYLITGNDGLLDQEYNPAKAQTNKDLQALKSLVSSDSKSNQLLQSTEPTIQSWIKYADELVQMRNMGQGEQANIREASGEGTEKASSVHANLQQLLQLNESEATRTASSLSGMVTVTLIIIVVLTLLATVIAIVLGVPATFNTPRNVETVTAILKDIASAGGDLRRRIRGVNSKDEVEQLADVTNELLETIGHLVRSVVNTSESVAASAQQLTASTDETARAVSGIAQTAGDFAVISEHAMNALQEMNHAVENVKAQSEQVAEKVDEVAHAVEEVVSSTTRGTAFVEQSRGIMARLEDDAQQITSRVAELESSSHQIAKITESIRAIAEQTNLLSLNAAIEAARAGEAGRGFAVVAQEVRKLAEQSRTATQEIAQIVRENQKLTQLVAGSMKAAVNSIREGVEAALRTSGAFEDIQSSVDRVTPSTADILKRVRDQAEAMQATIHSIQSVSQYMEQVAAGSEENAASTQESLATVEEIAASAHELSKLAQQLQELVGKFQV